MSAEYMHIGIPITNRKPNMTYNEGGKFWVSCVDDYDYKIEYLKFEEGTPFPEEIHRHPHVAYKVDDLDRYIARYHLRLDRETLQLLGRYEKRSWREFENETTRKFISEELYDYLDKTLVYDHAVGERSGAER